MHRPKVSSQSELVKWRQKWAERSNLEGGFRTWRRRHRYIGILDQSPFQRATLSRENNAQHHPSVVNGSGRSKD